MKDACGNVRGSILVAAVLGLAAVLFAAPGAALDLGEAHSSPVLGEPLNLHLPIEATAGQQPTLEVRVVELATSAEWLRDAAAIAHRFDARVVHDASGRAQVLVTSRGRLNEPYVDLTLELSADGERVRRTITLLPVAVATDPGARMTQPRAQAPAPPRVTRPSAQRSRSPAPPDTVAPALEEAVLIPSPVFAEAYSAPEPATASPDSMAPRDAPAAVPPAAPTPQAPPPAPDALAAAAAAAPAAPVTAAPRAAEASNPASVSKIALAAVGSALITALLALAGMALLRRPSPTRRDKVLRSPTP